MTTTETMQKAEEYQPLEYRVFRNEDGRYQAQRNPDPEFSDWYTIPVTYAGLFGGVYTRWDSRTPDEAEKVCRDYAADHKKQWRKKAWAGVVRNLGKLP